MLMENISVKLGKYLGVEISPVPATVSDAEVEAAFAKLCRDYAGGEMIDDAAAKSVFGFDSADALKGALRLQIEEQVRQEAKMTEENAAVDAAVENALIHVPEELIEAEVEKEFALLDAKMQQNGMNMEQYFSYMGVSKEQYLEQARPNVVQQLKVRALLDAVAKAEGIRPSEAEVKAEISRIAAQLGTSPEAVAADVGEDVIASSLAAQAALDLIAAGAVIR